ncbi:hypothetical protein FBU30_003907 [Linnemannia zychae]|nr:hypothetical protein FBU30_003907 [Linnemannia zychae]
MAAKASSAHDMMRDTGQKFTESTRETVSAVQRFGPVQNYVMPMIRYVHTKYQASSPLVKIMILTFAALSAIPVACYIGFMGAVTMGCLVVGGIAFIIVEGAFAMFGSAFLLPALGVVCLVSAALGLFTAVMYAGYMFSCYMLAIILGPTESKRDIRGNIQQGEQQAHTIAQKATGA